MSAKDKTGESQSVCTKCGKKIARVDRAGSLTSYLFQPFNCACALRSGQSEAAADPGPAAHTGGGAGKTARSPKNVAVEKDEFCPACGLQRGKASAAGSITGFMFQATRCKCAGRSLPSDDEMAQNFWKLKQDGLGNIFEGGPATSGSGRAGRPLTIDLLPGAVIGGVYRVTSLIGKGGMGEVYLAQHLSLGKKCALKLIPPDQVTGSAWKRFQNEAKSIAGLDHVNLVKVTDLGIHEGCLPYCAMEYIEGQTAAEMLVTHGAMPLNTVLDIFMQICDGVGLAHRKGVIHRDLKPANIMLSGLSDGKFAVKILDFGLAKLTQSNRQQQSLTSVGEVFGSPFYMSPEQCLGGKIDNRTDIYSIGCTMFECLTGRPPFLGDSAVEIITAQQNLDSPSLDSVVGPKVFPHSLEVVLAKLLRKNPVERYQTLAELREDLEKVARGEDVRPFYVSRGKSTTFSANSGEGAGDRSAKGTQTNYRNKNNNQFRTGIVLVALCLLISLVWGYTFLRQSAQPIKVAKLMRDKTQGLELVDFTRPVVHQQSGAAAPASAEDLAPYSTIVNKDGHQIRVFNFPSDIAIGNIIADGLEGSRVAKGKLTVPAESRIYFTPFPAALHNTAYLRRFRPGDVYKIQIPYDADSSDGGGVESCLRAMSQVPGVKALDLRNYLGVATRDLSILEKFDSINELDLGDGALDVATIMKMGRLKEMAMIQLSTKDDLTALLKSLHNSKKMLALNVDQSSLTLEQITDIASMANLENLEFYQTAPSNAEMSGKALKMLSRLQSLRHLSIAQLPLNAEAAAALRQFNSLATLRLDRDRSGLSISTIRQIEKACPSLQLQTLSHDPIKAN